MVRDREATRKRHMVLKEHGITGRDWKNEFSRVEEKWLEKSRGR